MTEQLLAPQQTQSRAQAIGLEDGQFQMLRNAKDGQPAYMETGWSVESLQDYTMEDGGQGVMAVVIKTDENGQVLEKGVDVKNLLSWQPAEQAQVNPLEAAKAKFAETSGVSSLVGGGELDDAIDALSPQDYAMFQQWQIEQAAHRKPNVWEVIAQVPKDETGNRRVPAELTNEFQEGLTAFGLSREAPTNESIAEGIARAKQIVESGQAANALSDEEFIDDRDPRIYNIDNPASTRLFMKEPMYIDPSLIKSASGHDSWAGRGVMGREAVGIREMNRPDGKTGTRSSIAQIEEYATRETPLPKLEFGIKLYLTKEGPIFYSPNAHRVSAAKLRGEPLALESISICDLRNR